MTRAGHPGVRHRPDRLAAVLAPLLVLLPGAAAPYEEVPVPRPGSVSGVVMLQGPAPEPLRFKVTMGSDPEFCRRIADDRGYVTLPRARVSSSGTLADVVVFVQELTRGKPLPADGPLVTVQDCQFRPLVTAGTYGQPLRLRMHDTILHQIRGWEMLERGRLPLLHVPHFPPGEERANPLAIRRSSIVKLECDQHRFMQGWVLVTANPYFAVTDETGRFELAELPAGRHTIGAWHPVLGYQEATVTVGPAEEVPITVTFSGSSPPR